MTPFRSEKDSNWEGAFRVPAMVRWPGNQARRDFQRDVLGVGLVSDLLAAAGDTTSRIGC